MKSAIYQFSRGLTTAATRAGVTAALFLCAAIVQAQDHTIIFGTTDLGVSKGNTNWGLDTCWASADNMKRGLIFMGTNNVTIVRVGFFVDSPLTNGDVTTADKSSMQTCINLASLATSATRWDMNLNTSVNAYYQSGANLVFPDRWAAAIEACQKYYNRSFWSVEGFNEPDYTPNAEGSPQNLYDIFGYLQASTNFPGTLMSGGSTLNDDVALSYFNPVASRASIGTTHSLAGSAANYVNFIQTVAASNAMPFNPEMHNVMEAIMGVNYGLKGGIWWGSAELARGEFIKASQGKQLGYADDLAKWTAAAVYRGTNGAVQAFVGASERMATTTSYQFVAKDRDVFFDGNGPQRAYTVTIPGGTGYQVNQPNAEKVVNITWGADIQPAINGRYIIVNRNSHLALQVPGSSTNNGIQLAQAGYTGALNQQWDVNPIPSTFGGDYSYYSIKAAHSGVTADQQGGSYANGAVIQQWNGGTNVFEQFILQYTSNGYFKIRTRWCNKLIAVNGASTNIGATMVLWDDTGTLDQQWRLIPATVASYDFVAPAAPTGVIATPNFVSVQLNWNANSEPDFASYNVLRSTTNGGPYELIGRGLTGTTFTDKSANQHTTYYYIVQAVDRSMNTSGNSTEVSATPNGGLALLAHYAFDGNANDSSGNSNNASLTGSPIFVAGKYATALNLNGTNQSAMVPANLFGNVTNFTIATWVFWRGGGAWQRIFDFGNGTTQYMFLTPSSGSGTLRFAITTNGNAVGAEQIIESPPLASGQWRHVAVTRNGNTGRLYTNGVLAASGTMSISPANFAPVLNYLGDSQYPADPFLNGILDDMYLYNYALSDTEISRLMNGQPPPPVAPTTISAQMDGGMLNLSWPANYIGCQLESNSVGLLATNSWFIVSNASTTNVMSLPFDTSRTNVYFRLVYP